MSAMETPLTIRQHTLVRNAMSVVEEQALKVGWAGGRAPDADALDDLRSVGKIALCEAARRFDDKRLKSFAGYARLRVRGAMLRSVKVTTRTQKIEREMARAVANRMAEYFDDFDVLRHDEAEVRRRLDLFCEHAAAVMFATGAEIARTEADMDEVAEKQEYVRAVTALGELVCALKPDERALLDLLFGCGFDLQEAADQLSVDKSTAWRRLQRVLVSLHRELKARFIREAPAPRDDVPVPRILDGARGRP